MKITINHHCRICSSPLPDPFLSFGDIAIAGVYLAADELGKEPFAPLSITRCFDCGLIQLLETVPNTIYQEYRFAGGHSDEYTMNLTKVLDLILGLDLNKKKTIVEAGSNDGTLLRMINNEGFRTIGFEPSLALADCQMVSDSNLIKDYFTPQTAKKYEISDVSVFIARHVLEHIDNLDAFISTIKTIITPGGYVIIEVPDAVSILKNSLITNFFHEHLSYFGVFNLIRLMGKFNFSHLSSSWSPTHGGSILSIFKDGTSSQTEVIDDKLLGEISIDECRWFSKKSRVYIDNFKEKISGLKQTGTIAGYGAAQRTSSLLGMAEIDKDVIDFIVDQNSVLTGLYLPGVNIPIYKPSHMDKVSPDYTVIFARSHEKEILSFMKNKFNYNSQFISTEDDQFETR